MNLDARVALIARRDTVALAAIASVLRGGIIRQI
jgi:hypothetical protein